MCRLLGVIANKPVDLEFSLLKADKPFKSFADHNPDGWGIGCYENNSPKISKEEISAIISNKFVNSSKRANSKIIIAHVRKASNKVKAPSSVENSHPFQYENWLFAHNGSVNRDHLFSLLKDEYKKELKGQTDSEVFFYWILQCIKKEGDIVNGIKKAINEVVKNSYKYKGLNFLLSDGTSLYAFRYASINESYYSLYKLERNPSDSGPTEFKSKETGTLIRSKSLRNERAVLVCSERLTEEENWEEIDCGKLLMIKQNLRIKEIKILGK